MPRVALPGEHPGIGARNEFHRRRMVYFLQRIKQETSKELWHKFKTTYPQMLRGVPTTGRLIRWEELDEPSPPPVFGNTTEQD
jgi:hypothetical protein